MTRIRPALLPLLLIGIAPGCTTGTETGNPPRAGVSFELVSSDEQHFTVGRKDAGVNVITTARVGVQQLSLLECSTQAVTKVVDTTTVDLSENEAFEVPQQSVCVVELALSPRDLDWAQLHAGSAPNLSLGLAGLTTDSAPLFVEDSATPNVVFRPQTFDVKPDTELVLSLDVAKAVSYVELTQASPDADGAFVISDQQNGSILTSIQQRWATSWSLYAVNGSGGRDLLATGEAQ